MFLFSTPNAPPDAAMASRIPAAGGPVVQAIRDGAGKTGTGFDYLLRTAQRESALDPQAKASTSSATGLFQFIEQTWLGMVKEEGSRHGLAAYADAIKDADGGRLNVADPKIRQDILDLRRDPQLASVMAGALTNKNSEALAATLGRKPTQGELYMAHVMGARGATELIKGAATTPEGAAAAVFPEAAAANRPIFFDKTGKPRSLTEVYAMLGASHVAAGLTVATAGAAEPVPAANAWPGVAKAKGIMGLFSTEGSRSPVSDAVTRYWATPRSTAPRGGVVENGPRFFPRDGAIPGAELAAVDVAATNAGASLAPAQVPQVSPNAPPLMMAAPLPPLRPSSMPVAENGKPRGPLELSRFLRGRERP